MNKDRKNIVIIEPSDIIYEGLLVSIIKKEYNYSVFRLNNFDEINSFYSKKDISVILVNPTLIQNKIQEFIKIKFLFPKIYWIGIIYSFFDVFLIKKLNDTFLISDNISVIIKKINKTCNNNNCTSTNNEELTLRETEILKWLAKGYSNKEIADKLNISIHTAITHRKNIIEKTDIRSLSGLTIYAITKGIISI